MVCLAGACIKHTESMEANNVLTSWLSVTKVKKKMIEMGCVGLLDESWNRPGDTHPISDCIKHSPTPYHGAKRWILCNDLFGTTRETELSDEQKKQLHCSLEANTVWKIRRHGGQESIHSSHCTNKVKCQAGTKHLICDSCETLKTTRSLLKAINITYADDNNIKYIAKVFMTRDQFQVVLRKFEEIQILQKFLEKATAEGDKEFWTTVGTYGKAGLFKNKEVVKGMMMAVGVRAERDSKGKSMRGRRINIYLDNFLTTLASISTRALKLFNNNFSGGSARSMRQI